MYSSGRLSSLLAITLLLTAANSLLFAGPIHDAAMRGNMDEIRSLVASGTPVDELDRFGRPAIFYAVFFKHSRVVREIIELGANPRWRTPEGKNLLQLATQRKDIDTLFVLAPPPFKVRNSVSSADTHLFIAVRTGNVAGIRDAHHRGANLEALDNGLTVVEAAWENRQIDSLWTLLELGAPGIDLEVFCIYKRILENELYECGIEVDLTPRHMEQDILKLTASLPKALKDQILTSLIPLL